MTKEEVIAIINEGIEDNEKAVKVLEAFDDYTKENDMSELQAKLDTVTGERDDALRRYRERFTAGSTVDEETGGSQVEPEVEPEETDDVIDVEKLEFTDEED
jgi:hypothetical protein